MKANTSLTTKEIKNLMILSYKKYQNGAITELQAYRQNVMLANILRATEATEQEERIQALEAIIRSSR